MSKVEERSRVPYPQRNPRTINNILTSNCISYLLVTGPSPAIKKEKCIFIYPLYDTLILYLTNNTIRYFAISCFADAHMLCA